MTSELSGLRKQAFGERSMSAFSALPLGTAHDMGTDHSGKPLFDPSVFDSPEFFRNPYPYYRLLRDHYPVYEDRLHNCFYITRFKDISACYFDDEGFNTIPKGSSNGVLGNTQLELSGVEHRRRRNLYGQHLVGKSLVNRIPAIRNLAREMIAAWPNQWPLKDGRRQIELGSAFANEFPIRVVCEVLGFPREAQGEFYYWYNSMMSGLGGSATHAKGVEARAHLEEYVGELVAKRRESPGYLHDDSGNVVSKDVISKLCETKVDGDYLSTEEITSNIALVVGGGGETTRGAIMHMWYLLLTHPQQFETLREDDSAWDQAFHETLRHSTPIGGQPRHNTRAIQMHGVNLPAGSLINMVDYSANHDERVFAEPEAFNLFREDLYTGKILRSGYAKDGRCNHMAFGVGPHLCPGAWISHQEAIEGSKALLEAMPAVKIVEEKMTKDPVSGELRDIGINSIRELWLEFNAD